MEKIEYTLNEVDIRSIEESPINAQVLTDKDFNRLVKSIKKDKVLTSTVLLMKQNGKDKLMCISGHHRIKASKKAGLKKVPAIVIDEIDESSRIRLQLTHNDIHGNPDEGIVSILVSKLNEIDLELVEAISVNETGIETYKEQNIEDFQYVSICLKPASHEELLQLIGSHSVEAESKMIIEAEDYGLMKQALTLAFKSGFKTPGRAFRKFIDIVLSHQDEML